MQMDGIVQVVLPKNIRQMGTFGNTYKVYVEDFVYTYVHQFIHQRKKENEVLAAVLLGKAFLQDGQEYIFINGAQKVDFRFEEKQTGNGSGQASYAQTIGDMKRNQDTTHADMTANARECQGDSEGGQASGAGAEEPDEQTKNVSREDPSGDDVRWQEFWNRVYRRIKESFEDCEILGWYFNSDGSGLEIGAELQHFFEVSYRKGSRFLYYEDSVEKIDAFFVQEQHRLQRLGGYAVYYEKNPQMQEFMIAEREHLTPKPLRDSYRKTERDEVVENYRAIMNKLNEKPAKKRLQPIVYVAGAAVLALVASMGIGQIGNYQNLKVLERTMQTLSEAVGGDGQDALSEDDGIDSKEADSASHDETNAAAKTDDASTDDLAGVSADTSNGGESETDDGSSDYAVSGKTDEEVTTAQTGSFKTGNGQTSESDGVAQTDTTSGGQDTENTSVKNESATSSAENYYIVKKGDSLVSISTKLYGTAGKVEEICNLNSIENMDMIYEGQKLLLP